MKNGLELMASASVGIATCPTERVHAIIGTADSRMYAVKTTAAAR